MPNREFVRHADKYGPKSNVLGWWMSEKLDGMRCFYDGGITTGLKISKIHFANIGKMKRLVTEPVSTGMWTRYANVIRAPDWFFKDLPKNITLDGELYAGLGKFQKVMDICKEYVPTDYEWKQIEFKVFASPCYKVWLQDGKCNNTNYKKMFKDFVSGVTDFSDVDIESTYSKLEKINFPDHVSLHRQIELPYNLVKCREMIEIAMNSVLAKGGEGLMFVNPVHHWSPFRTNTLLKYKGINDDEGAVIGYTSGTETDKGSKLLGMIGSLKVQWRGKIFNISGFTDIERDFSTNEGVQYAINNPGQEVPSDICYSLKFPIGSKVTFKYRELSDDGIPKDARYFRKFEGV